MTACAAAGHQQTEGRLHGCMVAHAIYILENNLHAGIMNNSLTAADGCVMAQKQQYTDRQYNCLTDQPIIALTNSTCGHKGRPTFHKQLIQHAYRTINQRGWLLQHRHQQRNRCLQLDLCSQQHHRIPPWRLQLHWSTQRGWLMLQRLAAAPQSCK